MSKTEHPPQAASLPMETTDPTASPETLIELLSDSYVHEFLRAVRDEPKTARAIADESGASRPTVYRRLNRLREAGLVREQIEVSSDGYHRRTFRTTVDDVDIELGDGGFEVEVTAMQPPAAE